MRLKHSTTTDEVDNQTGEIVTITTSKTFSTKVTTDSFYMTFFSFIKELAGLKSIVDIKVLSCLCEMADYNTGTVQLTADRKDYICKRMDLKYQTVANSLTSLKKRNFISGKRGAYNINPEYFWYGTTDARKDLMVNDNLNFTIEFNS